MNTSDILEALDLEVQHLQQARDAIAGLSAAKHRGRSKATSAGPVETVKRRTMSAAGRKRIAEAQRKRWAKQKAAAKKATNRATKKTAPKKSAKKAAKKAAEKRSAKKVTVTKIPAKNRPERKPRVAKKAPARHALSSASETVAAPKNNTENT